MLPPDRTERLVRGVLLLTASALFSLIAWQAGAYNLANQNWTYLCVLGVVVAAVLVSRLGAKWAMRHFPALRAQAPARRDTDGKVP